MQCNSLGVRPHFPPPARPPPRATDDVVIDIPDARINRRVSVAFNALAASIVCAATVYNVVYVALLV